MYKTIKQSPSEKRGERGSKHSLLRLLVAIGIIAFATSMLAVSCGKTAGDGNNNNNNNNSGGNTCTGICPTGTLELAKVFGGSPPAWVKINDNVATISAAGLATATAPNSEANDADRKFGNLSSSFAFSVKHSTDATASIILVTHTNVTKDTITLPATSVSTSCRNSESEENALAALATGGFCRNYIPGSVLGGISILTYSHLGTLFNNTKTTSHARATMRCQTGLGRIVSGTPIKIDDTTVFNIEGNSRATCSLAVVNNGLGAGVEIDDAWVTDSGSTSEVELYAIGIDVSGKTIPQFSKAAGYGLDEFIKAQDNAAFKRLLQNNPWGELKFKVRIVTAANF